MDVANSQDLEQAPVARDAAVSASTLAAATLAAAALAACGGGGGNSSAAGSGTGGGGTVTAAPPTDVEASRFLAQASVGASRAQIAQVQSLGYAGWIDAQIAMPASTTRWATLLAGGFDATTDRFSEAGFDGATWGKLLSSPDTLRQRVTLALSEMMVVGIDGITEGGGWKAFAAANYLDLLEANAFGNHRELLGAISTNTAMGEFLTFRGSVKGDPVSGALPDENYAREMMQLFTIGLVELNPDGTPQLTAGATTYTYGQADVTGLARVFTGWNFDLAGMTGATATAMPDYVGRPMINNAAAYETGAKTFLGTTIPANTDAVSCMAMALDAVSAHPNVAPFFARQMIQRLVSSNPSPAYVQRIAAVFSDDGNGVKGNLAAVFKALLLDDEARSATVAAGSSAGKLREPMLRLAGWARAFGVTSPSNAWALGDTSDAATRLGQSPLRSPSVFNFFRPGYVPPNSAIATADLVAPEFQITNESTVVGAVNYLQRVMSGTVADLTADYSTLLAFADDAASMVGEINVVLASGQLSAATAASISTAVASMPGGTAALQLKRIYAALTLVVAAPEFVVLK